MRHREKTCCCQELLGSNDQTSEGRDTEDDKHPLFLVVMKNGEGMEQVRNHVMLGHHLSITMIKEEFRINNKSMRQI
jgi:hypothetical protein